MFRLASSLLASAVLVFFGTTLLGTTLSDTTNPAPASAQPKIIATVVAHAHPTSWLAVHGL